MLTDVMCYINDPQAGLQPQQLYFPQWAASAPGWTGPAPQPASVALDPSKIYVADTNGNIWYGVPAGPLSYDGGEAPLDRGTFGLQFIQTNGNIIRWYSLTAYGTQTQVPGGCSFGDNTYPAPIGYDYSFQLADDGNLLYVLGCNGYVYYFNWEAKAWYITDGTHPFTSIGYSRSTRQLWGLTTAGEPMVLEVGPLGVGGYSYTSYQWITVGNDLLSGTSLNGTGGSPGSFGYPLVGCNLVESFTQMVTTPCILAVGGAAAVGWNLQDENPILLSNTQKNTLNGELAFFLYGSPNLPANANQFGTNNTSWNVVSSESSTSSDGVLPVAQYSYPSTAYPPLLQVAEGGTGVAATGSIDLMWIVTNNGHLYWFTVPN